MTPEIHQNTSSVSPAKPVQSHAATSTTLISGKPQPQFSPRQSASGVMEISMVQRDSSYLDNMFGGANHHKVHMDANGNMISPDETNNDKLVNDKKRTSIINDLVVDPAILSPSDGGTPGHRKKRSSTIQGGFIISAAIKRKDCEFIGRRCGA